MRVLVTSSRTPHALAAIRRFGELGAEVTAGDSTRLSCGKHSRHTTRRLLYPHAHDDPGGFLEAVVRELRERPYDLLFPTFEEIFVLARHRDLIESLTKLHVMDYADLLRVHDKASLATVAPELGVRSPRTESPASLEALEAAAGALPYPVVIKLRDGNNATALQYGEGPEDLIRKFRKIVDFFGLPAEHFPIVQEKIEGNLLFTLFLADHGEMVGHCVYRPLRMFPEGGGTAFYRETVDDPGIVETSRRILEKLQWHGFLGLDFIDPGDGGAPYLIDANPRPSPAYGLGQASGTDFTKKVLEMTGGKRPGPAPAAKAGVRTKLLFVEVIWLAFQLMPGRGYFSRVRTVLEAFRKKREFIPDVHRSDDRSPSFWLFLYVHYFLFWVNVIRPKTGGFMFGCNFNQEATEDIDVTGLG